MNFDHDYDILAIQDAVSDIVEPFGDDYWRARDEDGRWPQEFCDAIAGAGWYGLTVPKKYGGAGMGIVAGAMLMRTIGRLGAAAVSSVHLNIFGLQPVIQHASEYQKERWLEPLVSGADRACFAVTEPDAGSDTTHITTSAARSGNNYIVNGKKIWTSTAQQSNKLLLVARTARLDIDNPTSGITLFYTNLDRNSITVRPIDKLARKAVDSNELFIDNLAVPVADRIGNEGDGFKYLLTGLNSERILVAASAIGGAERALERASAYARDRIVFGRPIGANQAIQHPLAHAWLNMQSAELLMWKAASFYDRGLPCSVEAAGAKYLAAETLFDAGVRAVRVHGGLGFAKEYHVERTYRESMLNLIAPISQELALCHVAEKGLRLPKSY